LSKIGVKKKTYIILMDDRVGGLDDVEGVQGEAALLAVGVEVLGTLGQGARDGDLEVIVNDNVRMVRIEQARILV
jgi:hypothetical protein